MNDAASLVRAVGTIFERLPSLVGDEWPRFRARLWALLDRLEDPGAEAADAARELLTLFRKRPAAYEALITERSRTIPVRGKSRSRAEPATGPLTRYVTAEILFATDRERGSGTTPATFYTGGRGSPALELGRALVSIPHDHRVAVLESPALWKLEFRADPEKHVVLLDVAVLSSDGFVTEAKKSLKARPRNEVLVFVHGYNVTFEDAARRTAQVAYDLQFEGVPVLYSWPSEGSTAKYTVDEANARWTQPHFGAFLRRLLTDLGAETVHVIAHSMGNRVLAETIGSFDPKALPAGAAALREIVFAAPDFDADTFAELARTFHGRAGRFTLYSASSDLPLGLSKLLHKYGRAGATTMVVDTVDTVDASSVNTSFVGHSYFGDERTLIGDLANLIRNRLGPDQRPGLERVPYEEHHYWRFRA